MDVVLCFENSKRTKMDDRQERGAISDEGIRGEDVSNEEDVENPPHHM